MIAICRRNIKLFFRDKANVLFSLLSVLIIIGLYVLFLGEMMTQGYEESGISVAAVRFLMDSWIMAGVISVATFTTTLGAFSIYVSDNANKINKDFLSAPVKRSSLTGGYVLSAYIIGVVFTLIAFVFAQIYIVAYGGELLPIESMLKVLGCILIAVLSSSATIFFIISFIKTLNAFATFSTIIGTMIGFLTGVYMPIGILPAPVQWVVRIFPVSHAAVLIRQIMMKIPMERAFGGLPAEVVNEFKISNGVVFEFGSYTADWVLSFAVLAITAIIFFALGILAVSRKKK